MSPFRKKNLNGLCLALAVGYAQAGDTATEFNIPAQNLPAALKQLANQGHLQMLYGGPAVQGKHSVGLKGRYTSQQALQKLLGGTGLSYSFTADKTVAVKPASAQLNKAEPTTLKPMTVSAERGYDATDPYNPTYVQPDATTGTKTDTPIMETPLNVQVITKQVMKDQQVITLDQALKNVSGVTTTTATNGGFSQNIYLRGFATPTTFP